MRLLYLTRSYTGHDARWLRQLGESGFTLGYLPLQWIDQESFALSHPRVELLQSACLPASASTERLDAAEVRIGASWDGWSPDVILAGPLTDAGYLATRICPERTLLMSWASDVLYEPSNVPGARQRLAETLQKGQHLFADCAAIAGECRLIAGHGFRSECVLPWGLMPADTPPARNGWRQRLGDEQAKVVFYGRGFAQVHQPLSLIEAFRRAHAQDSALRLWLAGDGGLRPDTEKAVTAAGLKSAVRFLGHLDQRDLAGCLQEADAYVACSLSDGSSLTLLQAMHAGLPCITSDLPGNREWLDGAGGWLVPVGDAAVLADAILSGVRLEPDRRAALAAANRSKVRESANLQANLPRLLKALEAVAGFPVETSLLHSSL